MQITADQLRQLFPNNKYLDDLADCLNESFDKYEINTVNRAAGFLAQCGHESNGFTVLKENLNYKAEALNKIFHKYFPTVESAQPYAHQPEIIANKIYANRMGNGDEASGDGYKFRGRGAIQLTGRDNYTKFGATLGLDPEACVADMETLDGGVESAMWFWQTHGLNAICDADDITAMTKRVNGGTIGLAERQALYEKAKGILS
jgi:putative chitinase